MIKPFNFQRSRTLLVVTVCVCGLTHRGLAQPNTKSPHPAITAMEGLKLAPDIKVDIFAAEPQLANPVAICVDERGRVYVCETFRQNKGVEDNRDHPEWVDDDLAATTVADRLAVYKKHLKENIKAYSQHEDRVRYLEDRDGNGRADYSNVYVGGFNGPLEGTGAGILSRRGIVYYACIPRLWSFRDDDVDGKADRRISLHDGFGVRVAFRGHDLHGLQLGPDGRLYFSLGDRGFHIDTGDEVLANPETGAIFRCEMDGKKLEVFATGFRNPQDLTFDEFGNLFTCDNNSDGGDRARWIHVLRGADYGWRMAFQYLPDRGPWNSEGLWQPYFPGQSTAVTPPITNLADGPAGLGYYPGTGLPEQYNGNFFLCDFRGSPAHSGVRTFKHKRRGATFEVIDPELFLWNSLATDIDFGPDSCMYVSDWVESWDGVNKGRIWRLYHEKSQESKEVKQVKELLATGLRETKLSALANLLEHANYRVRLEAQFELASRGDVETFAGVLKKSNDRFARMHSIWGLGQIIRFFDKDEKELAIQTVAAYLRDVDTEVRAAATSVIGEAKHARSEEQLAQLLTDPEPQVQVAAAMSLADLESTKSFDSIVELIASSRPEDFALRHAGIRALIHCSNESELLGLRSHPFASVRLAAVVALRRQKMASVSQFLRDNDKLVVTEAARAIYDEPIPAALPDLAAVESAGPFQSFPLARRIMAANYRLGQAKHAQRLAEIAANKQQPPSIRREALQRLGDWSEPSNRDPLLGMWRPLKSRDKKDIIPIVRKNLAAFLRASLEVRTQATDLASKLEIDDAGPLLAKMLWSSELAGRERAGVLLALGNIRPDDLSKTLERAVTDSEPRVRAAARIVLSETQPTKAIKELEKALVDGEQLEQQSAMRLLPGLGEQGGDALILKQLARLQDNSVSPGLHLDITAAARTRAANNEQINKVLSAVLAENQKSDPLANYRSTMAGGNAERGELIFRTSLALSCIRCHQVDQIGGKIGPELTNIGSDKTREYLLESIVLPNKQIAKGYETIVIDKDDGTQVAGILQKEERGVLQLLTAQGKTVSVTKEEIEERTTGKSSMPEVTQHLSLFDLRDLIEYLATLK